MYFFFSSLLFAEGFVQLSSCGIAHIQDIGQYILKGEIQFHTYCSTYSKDEELRNMEATQTLWKIVLQTVDVWKWKLLLECFGMEIP